MADKDMQESIDAKNGNGFDTEAGANAGFDLNTDENVAGTTHLSEPVITEPGQADEANEKLKADLEESKDKYIRLVAEFENYKRRSSKERLEYIQTAGREVITSMLDVLDDADRAQKQLNNTEDVKLIREGVTLVFTKLRNTMQAKGLKAMETIGTEFNADLHEAITEIPAPNESMVGKVMDEVTKGYYLNDKIIRHAKVVTGK